MAKSKRFMIALQAVGKLFQEFSNEKRYPSELAHRLLSPIFPAIAAFL
jgi:hypothetical protein